MEHPRSASRPRTYSNSTRTCSVSFVMPLAPVTVLGSVICGRAPHDGGDKKMADGDEKKKPGPEPERLKLPHEDWRDAVREALEHPPEAEETPGDEASDEDVGSGSDVE